MSERRVIPEIDVLDWSEWQSFFKEGLPATWDEWSSQHGLSLTESAKKREILHSFVVRPADFKKWSEKLNSDATIADLSQFATERHTARFTFGGNLPTTIPKPAEILRTLRKAIRDSPEISVQRVFDPFLRRPEASICPIFRRDKNNDPEQIGSGVLISSDSENFLVSAAHVFDACGEGPILIPLSDRIGPAPGQLFNFQPKNGSLRKEDAIDIGFIRLREKHPSLDPSLIFLDAQDWTLQDKMKLKDAYTLIGYPAEESESSDGLHRTQLTRISCDGVEDYWFRKLELDSTLNLLIRYRMKKGMNYRTMAMGKKLDVHGMSGGGIFAWSKEFPDPKSIAQPLLTGIVTTYDPHNNLFIITRLSEVVRLIRSNT